MSRHARESGFTLVEVVVAVLLLGLVVGAALSLYHQGILSWRRQEARIEVQENLRIGLDRMSRELRAAVYLLNAESSSVTFKSADGKTVRYYHRADLAQLMREVNGGHNPVAGYITALNLTYCDASSSEVLDPVHDLDRISFVRITLTGRKENSGTLTLTTAVRIRALS